MLGITKEIKRMISGCFHRKAKEEGGSDISQTTGFSQKEKDQASTLVDDVNKVITYPDYFLEEGKERLLEQALFHQALRVISDAFKFCCSVEGEIFFDYVFRNNHDENLLVKINGILNGDIKSFTLNAKELLTLNKILYGIHKSYRVKVEGEVGPKLTQFLGVSINEILEELGLSLLGDNETELSPFCLSNNKKHQYYETYRLYYDLLRISNKDSLCRYLIDLSHEDLEEPIRTFKEKTFRFETFKIRGKQEYGILKDLVETINDIVYIYKDIYHALTLRLVPKLSQVETSEEKNNQYLFSGLLDLAVIDCDKAYKKAETFLKTNYIVEDKTGWMVSHLVKELFKQIVEEMKDIMIAYEDSGYRELLLNNEVTLNKGIMTRIYIGTLFRLNRRYLILMEFQNKIISKLEEYEKELKDEDIL